MAEITQYVDLTAGELSKLETDEVWHGSDSTQFNDLGFSDIMAAIYRERGYDEYVERQVSYLATRGREMKEPWTYASAPFLPNTSPRAAAYAARKKQLAQYEFDTAYRPDSKAQICPAQRHQWVKANRIRRIGVHGATGYVCRLCVNERALRAYRKNPSAGRAHSAVRYAISTGTLKRQPCEVCGATIPTVHAHHDDYSEPLDVRWLCFPHHVQQHHNLFTKIRRIKASVLRKARVRPSSTA